MSIFRQSFYKERGWGNSFSWKPGKLTWMFVPGQNGGLGNEGADNLVGPAHK